MALSSIRSVFSYTNLVHAVSGAVGSVVSLTIFYPLDTARVRLQVDDERKAKHSPFVLADIVREEGFLSLYRGLIPVVTSLCFSNFVYFYTYNSLKVIYLGAVKSDPLKDLFIAFVAGIVNVLITTPMWVVNTRLKLQGVKFETEKYLEHKHPNYQGILDCLIKIIRYEGISALWNGTKPSLFLATNPAIHFMVYEMVKRYFQRIQNKIELSGFLYFVIGAIAKTAATVLTYPLQVLQARCRAGFDKDRKSMSMMDALQDMIKVWGVKGLYKGMEAKLIQTVLTAALMFMVYEKLTAVTFRLMGEEYRKTGIV